MRRPTKARRRARTGIGLLHGGPRLLVPLCLLLTLVFLLALCGTAQATRTYTSIRGSDRYDTAIRISKAMFPGTLPADGGLVLAPGETFPEALCGAPLAAAYGGPVLLTPGVGLNNGVKAEMLRLAPKYVFCVGLSTAVVNAVKGALPTTTTVTAINGTGGSIYDMSRKVANALEARVGDMSGATAIITLGTVFPDAIGVSPLACAKLWPILLTEYPDKRDLGASATGALTDLNISTALKAGTYATLPAWVTGLSNLSGTDRYVTNVKVADWATAHAGLTFTHTGLATGDKFPDALAAGPYLAVDDGILLLTPLYGPLPTGIGNLMSANVAAVEHVSLIAMIEPVISQVKALMPPVAAPAPVVTGVGPSSGSTVGGAYGGTPVEAFKVVITGSHFTGTTAVNFGTTPATSFTVDSDTRITAVAPPRSAGMVHVTVTTPGGTSAAGDADRYTYYYFRMVNGAAVQDYSLASLQAKTAVAGYGGYLNTFPSFRGPWSLVGVSVLDLLADVGGLPAGHGISISAADGYGPFTLTYDQVQNNSFAMYDPSSDPHSPVVVTSITGDLRLIVAYQKDGTAIPESDGGPLRIALVSPVSGEQATDSVNWVKYVVKIEVLP